MDKKVIGGLALGIYLLLRVALDSWWRELSPWMSYAFELVFVGIYCFIYRQRLRFVFSRPLGAIFLAASTLCGAVVYKSIVSTGLEIPFDLKSQEVLFVLLFFAPFLEEFIFRVVLWEATGDFISNRRAIAIVTTILFSITHLQAYFFVPAEYHTFVLVQGAYVTLLGLGCAYAKIRTQSISGAILTHLGFNWGFYLGSFL